MSKIDAATRVYMFEALDDHADPANPLASAHWLADQFSAPGLGIVTTEEEAVFVILDWMQRRNVIAGIKTDAALAAVETLKGAA
jgi:hypothetical protein